MQTRIPLAAIAGAALVAATPAAADTTLKLDRAAGSPVRAVAPATADGRTVTLPVASTSGPNAKGVVNVRHRGGLRIGGTRLTAVRARVTDGGARISAKVGKRRAHVFAVRGGKVTIGDDGGVELRRGALRLTRAGAKALDRRAGRRVGTVTVESAPAVPDTARAVTGGQLSWGYNPTLRNSFGRIFEPQLGGGVAVAADGTYTFPVTGTTYDPESRKGTITSAGSSLRIGYTAGPAQPTEANGIWVTLRDVTVNLDGADGTIEAVSDSGFHGSAPVAQAKRTIATLRVGEPTVSGSTYTWTAVPATVAPGGIELVSEFKDMPGRPPLGDVRALDPVTITATLAP